MHKIFRLPTLTVATAVAFSGIAVVAPTYGPTVSVAVAQEAKANIPAAELIDAPADAQRYAAAYATFDQVYKARAYYAAGAQRWYTRGAVGNSPSSTWIGRHWAESAAKLAESARLLALLQAENFGQARDVNLAVLGESQPEAQKAFAVLDAAVSHFEKIQAESGDNAAREALVKKRVEALKAARFIVNRYVKQEQYANAMPAMAVVNYGVPDEWLEQGGSGFKPSDFAGVAVYTATYNEQDQQSTVDVEAVNTNGQTNARALEAKFGPVTPAPISQEAEYNNVLSAANTTSFRALSVVDEWESRAENLGLLAELAAFRGKVDALATKIRHARNAENKSIETANGLLNEAKTLVKESDELRAKLETKQKHYELVKEQADQLLVAETIARVYPHKLAEKDPTAIAGVKEALDKLAVDTVKARDALNKVTAPDQLTEELKKNISSLKKTAEELKSKVDAAPDKDAAGQNPGDNQKPNTGSSNNKKLSGGAIAGIVVGVLAAIAALAAAAVPLLSKFIPGLATLIPGAR